MNVTIEYLIDKIGNSNKNVFTKEEILNLLSTYNDYQIPVVKSDGIIINLETCIVEIDGTEHMLPKRVFNLLHYFITNKNKNLTRNQIIANVWGTEICVDEHTVVVHIHKLRKLLHKDFIITNKCFGYRWQEN